MGYYSDATLELTQANAANERLAAEVARLQAIVDELTIPAMDGYYAAAVRLRADNNRLQAIVEQLYKHCDAEMRDATQCGNETASRMMQYVSEAAAEAARAKT
jgi:CheY-like chemotaxis protein